MTFTKSLLALSVAGFFFVSCKDAAKSPEGDATAAASTTSEAPAGKMETASFSIEGMSCSVGCAKTIEKKLATMDGVQKASVDFEKKTATVEFDASKQTPEKLVKTVEAAADGKTYKVSNVKSSGDHAMFINKDREKKTRAKGERSAAKNKKKAETKPEEKKECSTTTATEGKPGCCAAKKSCGSTEAKTL